MDEEVLAGMRRKAAGYFTEETVEEYAACEGELTLVKRKITRKEVPPDAAAVRLLAELTEPEREPTYEEIERERARLLELLWRKEHGDHTEQV